MLDLAQTQLQWHHLHQVRATIIRALDLHQFYPLHHRFRAQVAIIRVLGSKHQSHPHHRALAVIARVLDKHQTQVLCLRNTHSQTQSVLTFPHHLSLMQLLTLRHQEQKTRKRSMTIIPRVNRLAKKRQRLLKTNPHSPLQYLTTITVEARLPIFNHSLPPLQTLIPTNHAHQPRQILTAINPNHQHRVAHHGAKKFFRPHHRLTRVLDKHLSRDS